MVDDASMQKLRIRFIDKIGKLFKKRGAWAESTPTDSSKILPLSMMPYLEFSTSIKFIIGLSSAFNFQMSYVGFPLYAIGYF